jgi:hypothetical protein
MYIKKPDHYMFFPGQDSGGNDITNEFANNHLELKKLCDSNPTCNGFNSNGWVKHTIKPASQRYVWTQDASKGLFVKKPDVSALGCFGDGGWRAIPNQMHNVSFTGDGSDGRDECMKMAFDNGDNVYALQNGGGGEGAGRAQCFTGRNPDYARYGARSNCGPMGGAWTQQVYSINPSAIPLVQNPTLSQGNRIGVILNTTNNYILSFDITPLGVNGGWSNILRFTYTDNNDCCNSGDRSPAIWFHPGSTGLHVRIGDVADGNWGIDTAPLSLNQEVHVVITCIDTRPTVQAGSSTYTGNQPQLRTPPAGRPLYAYASDRYYPVANATIKNLLYQIV